MNQECTCINEVLLRSVHVYTQQFSSNYASGAHAQRGIR